MRESENNDGKEVLIKKNKEDIDKDEIKYDLWFGITLPGRIIFTLYSLHGLFFIYNIIIEYIILIPGLLFEIKDTFKALLLSIIFSIFALSASNILVIPTFEFFSFPFLMYKNPYHIRSFIYIYKEKEFNKERPENKNSKFFNFFFLIFEILYAIGLGLGYVSNSIKYKDWIKLVILMILYSYYLIIILCYFFTSCYFIKKIFFIEFSKKCCCDILKFWDYGSTIINHINLYFKNKPDIPNVNLFSYLINPFLRKNYKKNNILINENDNTWYLEDFIYGFGIIIKLLLAFISVYILSNIFISIFKFNNLFSALYFILLFIVMTILSISLNFPFFYRNRKTFGTFSWCCNYNCNCFSFIRKNNFFSSEIIYDHKESHPFLVSFTRAICDIIISLVVVVMLGVYYKKQDSSLMFFDDLIPSNKTIDTKNLLLPNICYSSIHNMPLMLFLPFINDAYYYNNVRMGTSYFQSSFDIPNYKKFFFSDDYNITVLGNLIKRDNYVKMVQYNVVNKKNYITILSIKGTSYNTDIYLDAQLYFSSILLNLLSTFSILTTKDSYSFKIIEYSLSIPYRLFFRYLYIDGYLKELQEAYRKNEYSFFKNVVIVGHSLGGGLSKLFGRLMNKQAISLSGPGINAFHSLWEYEGYSENFEISAIDLVPDMDLVPRVEVSGGTIYRIICKEGVLSCHSKELSLCEVLIMCRNPNYDIYCKNKKFANLKDNQIKEIYESSELNKNK